MIGSALATILGRPPEPLAWLRLRFPRDLDSGDVLSWLRAAASERRSLLLIEVDATKTRVTFRLGGPESQIAAVGEQLRAFCPTLITERVRRDLGGVVRAWRVRIVGRYRPVRSDDTGLVARTVMHKLAQLHGGERAVLQIVLGPRLDPRAAPVTPDPWSAQAWSDTITQVATGRERQVEPEARRALQSKVAEPGFHLSIRVGVTAAADERCEAIAQGLLAALRVAQAPGVGFGLRRERPRSIVAGSTPWRWPASLNVVEVAALLAWPYGTSDYPGVVRGVSQLMAVPATVPTTGRVVGDGTHPASRRPIALSPADSLLHLHISGPTGVGKSTLISNLIVQDIAAGRGVIAIDPKGDLVSDVLARIPEDRVDDVVVLDPADESRPVGLNPLYLNGRIPELVADNVLAVFHGLYKDNWGPRLQDILHASLLTLAATPGSTLCSLPVLFFDSAYRRRVTGPITDITLRTFWSWFSALGDNERRTVVAPVMNKLNTFLLRPRLRAVLAQPTPNFDLRSVFSDRKIVLVSLAKGLLGEASALLGALVVSDLWSAALARVAVPPERRHPVMCYIDEFHEYTHLPTDLADVLAQARGLGLSMTLANQQSSQLSPSMRQAIVSNARSKVYFQLGADDATTVAKHAGSLDTSDFQSLSQFEMYASLAAGGQVTGFASGRTRPLADPTSDPAQVRALSRQRYGQPIEDIEATLAALANGSQTKETNDKEAPIGKRPRRRT